MFPECRRNVSPSTNPSAAFLASRVTGVHGSAASSATWQTSTPATHQAANASASTLTGTILASGPRTIDALHDAEVSIDLRSLDEVIGALLDREVTLYPNGQDVCALRGRLVRTSRGIRLATECECDWDRALETFEAGAGMVELAIDVEAEVAALLSGRLP